MNIAQRKKLIKEIIDSDKDINARVANIQKKKLLGIIDEVIPFTQLNQEDIQKMTMLTSILKQLLEKKLLFARQFMDSITNSSKIPKYIIELGQTEEIRTAYNNVVSIYLNPSNTQETKTQIKRILISFEDYIISIINNYVDIIQYMKTNRIPKVEIIIHAFTLYEIILSQFEHGNFFRIMEEDLKVDFEKI